MSVGFLYIPCGLFVDSTKKIPFYYKKFFKKNYQQIVSVYTLIYNKNLGFYPQKSTFWLLPSKSIKKEKIYEVEG
jgi:hypothetical protein